VLKENRKSHTLHLLRNERGQYTDVWAQRYDLNQPEPTPGFLAEWYGRRAAWAVKHFDPQADPLTRTALRYAFQALPEEEKAA
jgi:hypothetical protein